MFIQSDDNNPVNYNTIQIQLEHCDPVSGISCATEDEKRQYWVENSTRLGLGYSHSQIEMSNITQPVQNYNAFKGTNTEPKLQ